MTVRDCETLREALMAVDRGTAGAVLITDQAGFLKGVLTDGDIRRGLLRGMSLEDPLEPLIRTEFFKASQSMARADVLDLMTAHQIQQVPIVDDAGRLIGLHLLREIVGRTKRPNWAVVMAGGEGRRLRPHTEGVPKPMLPVAGRPILERIILHLVGAGIERVFLSVNYLAGVIEEHFGDGSDLGCRIDYVREEESMGSGGALSLLPEQPSEPLLIMNGDLVTDFSVGGLLDYHEARGFVATIGLQPYRHGVPYGCVTLDNGQVTALREKPILQEIVNAGVYAISPHLLARVPREFFPITELFEDCLRKGEKVGGYLFEESWLDVGQPAELRRARGLP